MFNLGMAYVLLSLIQLPWAKAPQAIAAGLAWGLMLTSVLANLACGFAMGRLAAARSRDAYGHASAAVLAFVPLINLWLWFVPSKGGVTAPQPMWLARGFVGVLAGLFFFGLGSVMVKTATTQMGRGFLQPNIVTPDLAARFLLNNLGLEDTLGFLARSIPVPLTVDVATTMTRAEAHGSTLEATYRVVGLGAQVVDSFKSTLAEGLCSSPVNPPLLRAGAVLRHIYYDPEGHELLNLAVTAKDCGL